MKALSIRAPWWFAILHFGKDIENRTWATNFRGTVYLHAGKWFEREEVAWDLEDIHEMRLQATGNDGALHVSLQWLVLSLDGSCTCRSECVLKTG